MGRGTPGPWMGTPPPHPIGMAALYLAEPRQRLGGGGGKRRSLVSEQPRAGVHSDRRPHAPPLSPGTGHRPPRKSLRRRKGAAGWRPRSEVGSSEPGFRDPRSLWSCCRLSCASPGAIATPHRALRGRLFCGAHPDGGARGPDGSVSGARAGVGWGGGRRGPLGGGFAYGMEPTGPQGTTRAGREAKCLLSSRGPGGEAGGAHHGAATAQSRAARARLCFSIRGGPRARTHVTTAWKRSVADVGKKEKIK